MFASIATTIDKANMPMTLNIAKSIAERSGMASTSLALR
jgi:hypothetical protein